MSLTSFALLCFLVVRNVFGAGFDAFLMADWGGQPNKPYTTTDEVDSAKVMGELGDTFKPSMVWVLGDNFYDSGVKNEYDPRFQETFESVFTASSIKDIPYYVVAGNHDHYGNVTGEIMYSNHSQRWIFPNYYYKKIFDIPSTNGETIELVLIDTVQLCGGSMDYSYCKQQGIPTEICVLHPKGPSNKKLAESQWQWIERQLNSSQSEYLIVAGHYPVWSIAEHGPTKCLVDQLRPMLIKYNATMYICGHDHTFEYIVEPEYPNIGYPNTGGTHTCDSSTSHQNDIPKNSLKFHGCDKGGFTHLHADNNGLYLEFYYGSGTKKQYTTQVFHPRNK